MRTAPRGPRARGGHLPFYTVYRVNRKRPYITEFGADGAQSLGSRARFCLFSVHAARAHIERARREGVTWGPVPLFG